MKASSRSTRRHFFRSATLTGAGLAAASLHQRLGAAEEAQATAGVAGKIRHSACKWCYPDVSLDDLCASGKAFGLSSVDLLQPADFPTLKKHGLVCAMVANPTAQGPDGKEVGGIPRAFNRLEHHDALIAAYETQISAVAEAGLTNLICFSGNRDGLDDETGMKHCATGLKRLMKFAEAKKVTLCMELLNSKVNHPDYMCDHTEWGAALCQTVGSERFKLLYDIYHMQIMEGDVIATLPKHQSCIAHYHTGGVPGRHEIDETQELQYPAIMRAIVATGYTGHVAQEFIPAKPDKLGSLKQAIGICTV